MIFVLSNLQKMRKLITTCIALSICVTFSHLAIAQSDAKTQKEELAYWSNRAKVYKKKPLSLKAEFEKFQSQIAKLKEENEQLQKAPTVQAQGDSSIKWELYQTKGELEALKEEYERLKQAYATRRLTGEMGIPTGLVFRIQIGAFVFHKPDLVDENVPDMAIVKNDGFNKFVVGGFRELETAEYVRSEVQKLGIDDAWVVPYIDGVRVSMKEANEYLEGQGYNTMNGRSLDGEK